MKIVYKEKKKFVVPIYRIITTCAIFIFYLIFPIIYKLSIETSQGYYFSIGMLLTLTFFVGILWVEYNKKYKNIIMHIKKKEE